MELVLEIFGWLIRALFSGIVFAGALHYMEGKRILRGTVSVLFCGAAGMLANLVSDGLLYGLAGFSRQGAAGVFAGLAMAALMAASFSAAGCLSEEKGAQQREGAGDPAAAGSGSLKRLVKGCGIRYNNLKSFCLEQKSGTLCVPQEPDGSSLRTLYHARLCSTKRRWIGSVEDRL